MKRSLFKKLIGVCLAVTIAVGGVTVSSASEKEYMNPMNPKSYTDRTEWTIDRAMQGGGIYIFEKAEIIPTNQIDARSLFNSYSSTDFSRYSSVLCVIRTDRHPEKICGFAVGYLSDGTAEIIYDDTGYDCLGFNREGWSCDDADAVDWQGYDREGYDAYDGYNREGYDRSGHTIEGYSVRTGMGEDRDDENGHHYYYYEDEVKPITFTYATKKAQREGGIAFMNCNESYYKVTVSGLKNSKYVEPEITISKDKWDPYYLGEDYCSRVPVKDGKATFYTRASKNVGIINTFDGKDDTELHWRYSNSEKNVSVTATPMAKSEMKNRSKIKVSKSKVSIKKDNESRKVTIWADEPVELEYLTLDGGRLTGGMLLREYIKMNKNGSITFTVKNTVLTGMLKIRGMYSGNIVKIKVTNTSPYAKR